MAGEVHGVSEIHGILLAAGESRRMGFPKPLLKIGAETYLARLVTAMLTAVPHLTVVIGAHAAETRAAAPLDARVTIVENHEFARGQLSSLKAGLRASASTASAVMVHLIDHPMVAPTTFSGIVAEYQRSGKPIVIARYKDRRGHPVIFGRALFDELLAASEEQGARAVVHAEPSRVGHFETADPAILMDLDTPADVAQAGLNAPARSNER
ncbi:MAG TPA: nucleotidyltransferase family protein [Candidatus Binataceae bacterium]|nr:nucleotidyltransferase family protein [Candidatus Binataceae bacterium]